MTQIIQTLYNRVFILSPTKFLTCSTQALLQTSQDTLQILAVCALQMFDLGSKVKAKAFAWHKGVLTCPLYAHTSLLITLWVMFQSYHLLRTKGRQVQAHEIFSLDQIKAKCYDHLVQSSIWWDVVQ